MLSQITKLMMVTSELTAAQLHALFDILTHAETYAEIEGFKHPTGVSQYGYPFPSSIEDGNPAYASSSSSPILQHLFSTIVLPLPPLQDLAPEFWRERIPGVLTKFAEAELSESYDKGALGTRKTLSTACSALLEGIGRGVLGGIPGGPVPGGLSGKAYESGTAEGLEKAWDEGLRDAVYGPLVGELFDFCAEHEDVEEHSATVKVAVEYVIIHIASFLHALLKSPDGPYLLKLLENLHKLMPYTLIKQTLRVGNAATMINGMVRLLLAKLGVGSALNWIGLTKDSEDGMNLLQRIASMILSWDSSEFQKIVDRQEKAKDGPTAAHLDAIRKHIAAPRTDHDAAREASTKAGESIIITILKSVDPDLAKDLSETDHSQCLEYYSALLSVRDRDEITTVLCHQTPDLLTQAIRDAVAAFDPVIRQLHTKVDLKEHLGDFEAFLGEFIEVGKGKKSGLSPTATPVTLKDLVELLHKYKPLLWKFLHHVARDCPEIRDSFKAWAQDSIKTFRNPNLGSAPVVSNTTAHESSKAAIKFSSGAGAMTTDISTSFTNLPAGTQDTLLPLLDAHATYLSTMADLTTSRLRGVLDQIQGTGEDLASTAAGPGLYLARWQSLMDETPISPATPLGPPRSGRDVRFATTQGKVGATTVVQERGGWLRGRRSRGTSPTPDLQAKIMEEKREAFEKRDSVEPPDTRAVVDALSGKFRELLVEMGKTGKGHLLVEKA